MIKIELLLMIFINSLSIISCASIKRLNYSSISKSGRSSSGNSVSSGSSHHKYFFHKLPTLSHEMSLHTLSYKPRTFSITSRKLSEKKILVEFNYTNQDVYTKYSIRMRYHNHLEEYMTNKTLLDKYEPNKIILSDFPDAQYVLCVTLHPSIFSSDFHNPALSTSDMCIDILFGQDHGLSGHNKTGLLMPMLLAVVVVQIISLPVLNKMRCERLIKKIKKRGSLTEKPDSKSSSSSSAGSSSSRRESDIDKNLDLKDMSLGHLLDLRKNEHELEYLHDTRQLNVLLHYDDPDFDDSDKDEYYIGQHENKSSSPNASESFPRRSSNESNEKNINFY